jgi:outer membrane protein assembly factor BamC
VRLSGTCRRYTALSCLLFAALLAGGCSTSFESKRIDYKSAGKLPPLEIPPDLTQPARDDRYAVPDLNPKGSATYSVYSAERSGQARTTTATEVLPAGDNVRVERSGTQRWLVVNQSAEALWPVVKEFWQEIGFIINIELADAGILETDWAENRAKIPQDMIRSTIGRVFEGIYSTAERDKFRTRLEPGAQPGTTEIYISHRGVQEVYTTDAKDFTVWQPRPPDPELEAEMLRRLMVRLGTEEKRAAAQVAQGKQEERARLQQGGEGAAGTLEVLEPFDRAWRRVGLALDRVGFTVEDRDRSKGLYYVRYVDPEADARSGKDQGFLSKLFSWGGSKSDPTASAQYSILVKGADSTSTVQVLTREGGADRSDTSKKILGLLYEQLK